MNRKRVNRKTVVKTTMVSWTKRLRVVQDTLFNSASVAIRKSANVGKFTIRYANHNAAAHTSAGTANCTLGKRRSVLPPVNGSDTSQLADPVRSVSCARSV